MIGAAGTAKIAPLYDLMCAAVYKQIDQSLPQNIAGRFNASDLQRSDWQALAENVGLSGASTIKRVEELAEWVSTACSGVSHQIIETTGDPTRVLVRVTHEIQKRCKRLKRQCQA